MKFCVLASGSSGNAFFVSDDNTRLLIDCGITAPHVLKRLIAIGEHPRNLTAILITHEHGDHIDGLKGVLNRWMPPVVCSAGTRAALNDVPVGTCAVVFTGGTNYIELGDLRIHPIPVNHDAAEPVAYHIVSKRTAITVATDLGDVSMDLERAIDRSTFCFIESNHDSDMLAVGPYPVEQKIRVSNTHLSNDAAFRIIGDSACGKYVVGHISGTNNNLDLLTAKARRFRNRNIHIAPPGAQTQAFVF